MIAVIFTGCIYEDTSGQAILPPNSSDISDHMSSPTSGFSAHFEYVSDDFSAFLSDWTNAQTYPENSLLYVEPKPGESTCMPIPLLLTEHFYLFRILADNDLFCYYYMPNRQSNVALFDDKVGITVRYYPNIVFDDLTKSLKIENGCAYNAKQNWWYIDVDGMCVSIAFPETIVLTNVTELNQYFQLIIYYAGDPIPEQVQSR